MFKQEHKLLTLFPHKQDLYPKCLKHKPKLFKDNLKNLFNLSLEITKVKILKLFLNKMSNRSNSLIKLFNNRLLSNNPK